MFIIINVGTIYVMRFYNLKVYESHNVLSLTKKAVLGSVLIQMSTIWSEPGNRQYVSVLFYFNTIKSLLIELLIN